MQQRSRLTAIAALMAAASVQAQTGQGERQRIVGELQSYEQRLKARYAGDLPLPLIEQRVADLKKQLERLGPAPEAVKWPFGPAASVKPVEPAPCVPVNENASEGARALLKRLCEVSGKGILTGQHNFPNHRDADTELVHSMTGKYPAIWGSDFGFTSGEDKDSVAHRDLMIEEAKRQHAAGSIIHLCWHMLRPTEDEPGQAGTSWRGSVQARLSDEQWQELIAADSPLHRRWEHYVDAAAAYLRELQDAGVPVLWRPMHENNGSFFWWGGRPGVNGTAQLWRELYNRLTYVHKLNNLVWVWNQNGPAAAGEFYDYYPGARYCDVVSYDNYRVLEDRYYHELVAIANGKPVGYGELGGPPSREVLAGQPRMSFYMTWGGMVRPGEALKAVAEDAYYIKRGEAAK